MTKDLYPVTITCDRYDGTYSHAKWVAFHCHPDDVPAAIYGSDEECANFWHAPTIPVGRGNTPEGAVRNLEHKLEH